VVTAPITGGPSTVEFLARLDSLIERVRAGELSAAGIDMPIGLPSGTRRASDGQLRVHLGARRSSIFPTPPRAVLDAIDYRDALARARDATGVGLSKQAWNLVGKIRELDALMTLDLQPRVSEAHPESSFAELAGKPLVTRKSTREGHEERTQLLLPSFPDVAEHLSRHATRLAVDVLDAFAAAWTARRVADGTAKWFGDDERDGRGLRMTVAV
jgi:predicted RNase H-like nuclease